MSRSSSTTTSRRRSRSAPTAFISVRPTAAPGSRGGSGSCSAAPPRTLDQALEADADYLGVGPVWETPSKDDADPAIGLEGLRAICAAVDLPVVAIGGIDASNAADCIRAGAAGVAVIRAATDPGAQEGR